MAVLARVNFVAQQRVDLNHVLAMESFLAFDFRTLVTGFSGLTQPYILRGFKVAGRTGLSLSVRVAESLLFNPLDANGSFYAGGADDDDILVDLPANQQNIYVQAKLTHTTRGPINTAFWDSLALSGDSVAGTEFSASTNTQDVVVITIYATITGFDEGSVRIARVSTNSSSVTNMYDTRDSLYRLGSGGSSPDPLHKFRFATNRGEPVYSGTGVGDDVNSPFRDSDATGVRNDKGLESLKDWMDAIMTRICEITGQSFWYDNSLSSGYVTGLTLNTAFFDSDAGHSYQPSSNVTITWRKTGVNYFLTSHGLNPVSWQANYAGVQWELGGTFTSASLRTYTDPKFVSPVPVEGGNIYLLLEREVPKGSGAAVKWADNSADVSLNSLKAISGVPDDFTGIAIGDYVRKESGGYSQYYKVAKLSDGVTTTTTDGTVADSTIVALELAVTIASGTSTEPLRYFRQRYSSADLYADQVTNVYSYTDVNFFWLGRRKNNIFILRGYGNLKEGEETTTLLDAPVVNATGGGIGELSIQHAPEAHLAAGGTKFYTLKTGTGTIITIYRRIPDNTAGVPTSSDNSDSMLVYTISIPTDPSFDTVGQSLWVRLSETTGGALTAGSVTSTTDDQDNTDTATNVWEVRTLANSPLRNYDNRNVFQLCRLKAIGAQSVLVFFDGSVLGDYGIIEGYNVELYRETKLTPRTNEGVLFISQDVDGQIDDDAANFYFDKTGQEHGIFNYRFRPDEFDVSTGADQTWMATLGAHTVFFGTSQSTLRIYGNLEVEGATTAMQTQTVQSDDKRITLGVGNLSLASGGSGLEVADDTRQTTTATPTSGQDYIDLAYGSPHGYTLGQNVGVSSNTAVGGITSGDVSGTYTVVTTATTAGDAQVMSATVLRIWTIDTATNSTVVTMSPPTTQIRTFDLLSYFRMTNADGDTSGLTSWAFKVKGLTQIVTLTPVAGYGISPTANSTSMTEMRIPFVGNDNSGPSGVDSTFDFSAALTWDGTNLNVDGNIIPQTDNMWTLGSPSFRWASGHFGPGSVVVHNDDTDTLYVKVDFNGSDARLVTDAATPLQMAVGANIGLYMTVSGDLGLMTNVPGARFHVYQDAASGVGLFVQTINSGNTFGLIQVANAGTGATMFTADDPGSQTEPLAFRTGNDTGGFGTGLISLTTGDVTNGTGASSGAINITTGTATTAASGNNGGWVAVVTGAADGQGGFFTVTTGSGGSQGGFITMVAGDGVASGALGGSVSISAGNYTSSGFGMGGSLQLQAGNASGATAVGGNASLTAGSATDSAGGFGGSVTVQSGDTAGAGQSAGSIQLVAGTGTGTDSFGGEIDITAGNATTGTGDGGDVSITAGNTQNGAAGNVTLTAGTATGSGTAGQVIAVGVFNLNNAAYIRTGAGDPSSVATDAPEGSLYLRQSAPGLVYIKQDNGSSTNWSPIVTGGPFNVNVHATITTATYTVAASDMFLPADTTSRGSEVTIVSNTNSGAAVTNLGPGEPYLGQTFSAGNSGAIEKVKVRAKATFGAVTGTIYAELRDVTMMTVLATSDTFDASTLSTVVFSDVTLNFTSFYPVISGSSYSIVLRQTLSGNVDIEAATSGSNLSYSFDGSTWFPLGTEMYFDVKALDVLMITLPAVSATNKGRTLVVKDKLGTADQTNKYIVVLPSGSDTIDGQTYFRMYNQYEADNFTSDGSSSWMVS